MSNVGADDVSEGWGGMFISLFVLVGFSDVACVVGGGSMPPLNVGVTI